MDGKQKIYLYAISLLMSVSGCISTGEHDSIKKDLQAVGPKFREAGLAGQYQILRRWSREKMLPMLAGMASGVDAKFEGVKNMGELIKQTNVDSVDIEKITYRNYDYWRAMLEMVPGDQLIPAMHVYLYVAQGQFGKAGRILNVIYPCTDVEATKTYFLDDLNSRLRVFHYFLEKEVRRGIRLHDQGRYREAIAVYKKILKDYPNSAWVNYEWFFSLEIMSDKSHKPQWAAWKQRIYACDPLYETQFEASSPEEGYEFWLRLKLKELLADGANLKEIMLPYADIASKIGQDGYAALLYHLCCVGYGDRHGKKIEDILEYFLYSLENLGVTKIKDCFPGNHLEYFKRIESERQKQKEENLMYKAMGRAKG